MKKISPLLQGTILLTFASLLSRFLGFFYRIWLARVIGETNLGLFQMIFPVFSLALALCSSGIHTAISRFTAEALAFREQKKGLKILITGLFSSLFLSVLTGLLLARKAEFLARHVLGTPECAALLPVFALMLPLASAHACVDGYYLGQKKAAVCAGSQLTEQCVRIFVTIIAWRVFLLRHTAPGAFLPVIGMAGGEAASFLFAVCALAVTVHKMTGSSVSSPLNFGKLFLFPHGFSFSVHLMQYRHIFQKLSSVACPLTMQRVLTGALGSLEAILLPLMLQSFGLTRSAALGTYGIFTGMAMPCIFFPSAITGSMSSMLMPAIAEANANRSIRLLENTIKKTAAISAAAGIACFLLFFFFGSFIGIYILGNETAGAYLRVLAWICPFLYLNTTLGSILNGLGQSGRFFAISILCSCIRLAGVLILVPRMGMYGHLLGLLASTILQTLSCAGAISRNTSLRGPCA